MLVLKNLLSCFGVGLLLVGSIQLSGVAFAMDYYVDELADSGGDGSSGLAWNSVSQVNAAMGTFVAGDHVYFKRGGFFRGDSLLINGVSGTGMNPVVFGAYGSGLLPIIDGSQPVNWQLEVENIYSTSFTGTGVNNEDPFLLVVADTPKSPVTTMKLNSLPAELTEHAVLIQVEPEYSNFWVKATDAGNKTVTGYNLAQHLIEEGGSLVFRYVEDGKEKASSESLRVVDVITSGAEANTGLTEGDWYWDKANKRIYLFTTDVPDNDTVQVNWEADGIRVENSTYVHVQDIKVQKFNKQGVVLYLSSNITIDGLEIYACGKTGIQVWDASDNRIQNNRIDSISGAISLWVLGGGTAEHNQIRNNTISNCLGACIGLSSDKVLNNTVSGNTITGANSLSYDGAGVYTFNSGSNTIQGNTISDCGSIYLRSAGIMVDVASGATTAPMIISGNYVSNNSTAGIAVSGSGHQLTGNTLVNNGEEYMDGRGQLQFFASGRPASSCTVTSNIIEADTNRQFLVAEYGSTSGHTIDYNCYCGQSSKQFSWAGEWMSFEVWQNKTRHDSHSVLNGPMPPLPPTILQFIPAILAGACK